MKLIVGLGNPGDKYAGNRHNIGFMAVDEMARGYSFGPWKKRFQGFAAEGQIGAEKCILLKPTTYMNESGRSVGEAMRFYKLPVSSVITVHDELDLKPGVIRVKTGGGNAGHNGLKSISAHIGNDYVRVRLGIGHPGDKTLVANYVLQDFAKADKDWLVPLLEGVARGMARLFEGSEAAFLSEAARGRNAVPQAAAKLNGAAGGKPLAKATDPDPLAVIAAAAARPIPPMPMVSIPVAAAREGGGGVTSRAVIMPEPVVQAAAGAVQAVIGPQRDVEPESAPFSPEEHANEDAASLAANSQIEWAPMTETDREPIPSKAQEQAKTEVASAAHKKRDGLICSWFRTRVRGGVRQ